VSSVMSSEAELKLPLWRWTTEGGELQAGSEEELIQQLASGELEPYALVWRDGWGEWLPALEVEALSRGFPDSAVPASRRARPSTLPGIPPVPVSEYPRVRMLAKGALGSWPSGAVSPLGVAVPYDASEEVITSEVPLDAMLEAARVMNRPTPPADLGLEAAVERASQHPYPVAFVEHDTPRSGPLSRPALPLAAEFGLEALLESAEPAPSRWPSWLRGHGLWVTITAGALGLFVVLGARWWSVSPSIRASSAPGAGASNAESLGKRGSRAGDPAGADQRVTPLSPRGGGAAAHGESRCSVSSPPVKLDDWAVAEVRPSVLLLPGGKQVAIGYAQSHKQATGGTLDIATLDFNRGFGQQQERQIVSVTPLGAGERLGYHVERMGALVAFGRPLDVLPPLRVGMSDAGIVAGPLEQRAERVWELPFGTLISVPEIARHAHGFTLATRAGRTPNGYLQLGLLSPTGTALSPLAQIGGPESEFGKPALASGTEQTVLAVTLRSAPSRSPALLLARAPNGQLPLELEPLDIFDDTDVELSAPAVAAFDDGFALMWSEGTGARRQVRLQRLSSTLAPLGLPVTVSAEPDPQGAPGGAGAGTLYNVGDRLLAFFFVKRADGQSLWVSRLDCRA
jgi:hypothetical protein